MNIKFIVRAPHGLPDVQLAEAALDKATEQFLANNNKPKWSWEYRHYNRKHNQALGNLVDARIKVDRQFRIGKAYYVEADYKRPARSTIKHRAMREEFSHQ